MIIFLAFLLSSTPTLQLDDQPPHIETFNISSQSVFDKLMNLKISKFAGPDGWPTQLIKSLTESICVPLSIIFNKSLDSGILHTS